MDARELAALFLADPRLFAEALAQAIAQERRLYDTDEACDVRRATMLATPWERLDDLCWWRSDALRGVALGEVAIPETVDLDDELTEAQLRALPVWVARLCPDPREGRHGRMRDLGDPCVWAEACALVDAAILELDEGWRHIE